MPVMVHVVNISGSNFSHDKYILLSGSQRRQEYTCAVQLFTHCCIVTVRSYAKDTICSSASASLERQSKILTIDEIAIKSG